MRRSPPQKRGYNIWNECNKFYNICLHVGVMGSGNWTDMIINWYHAGKKKGYYFLKKTVIKKVNTISTANREPHIPAHFIRPTVTYFIIAPRWWVGSDRQIHQNRSGKLTLKQA